MADPKHPHGFDALEDLAARVAKSEKDRSERLAKVAIDRSSMSVGLRMASEFASAILVGGLFGYGVDFLAKTSPWALLIGLVVGFGAGTVNLMRVSRQFATSTSVDGKAIATPDDSDDNTGDDR
jgi:ATP synthase protein I